MDCELPFHTCSRTRFVYCVFILIFLENSVLIQNIRDICIATKKRDLVYLIVNLHQHTIFYGMLLIISRHLIAYVWFTSLFSVIDPCESRPCQNNGRCTHGKNHSGFVCICTARHEGLLCEKGKR